MKSRSQIRMNFAKARADADKIDKIASTMKTLSRRNLENSMNDLAAAWTGNNSRLFLKKEGQLQKNIDQTVRSLNDIADDIRRIAQRVYEAEMRAYEIATRRKS